MYVDILAVAVFGIGAMIAVTTYEINKIIDKMNKEIFTDNLQLKNGELYKDEP